MRHLRRIAFGAGLAAAVVCAGAVGLWLGLFSKAARDPAIPFFVTWMGAIIVAGLAGAIVGIWTGLFALVMGWFINSLRSVAELCKTPDADEPSGTLARWARALLQSLLLGVMVYVTVWVLIAMLGK